MAGKQKDELTSALAIRYYIMDIVYRSGGASIRVPSSNELAALFGVTRQTAKCALERLIRENYLIGRRGSGTFTNPMAASLEPASSKPARKLVSLLYQEGDFFYYNYTAGCILSHLGLAVAEAGAFQHPLTLHSRAEEEIFREITLLNLDGLLWCASNRCPSPALLARLLDAGVPTVLLHRRREDVCCVYYTHDTAGRELATIFRAEKRRRFLVIAPSHIPEEYLASFRAAMEPDAPEFQVIPPNSETVMLRQAFELPDADLYDAIFLGASFVLPVMAELERRGVDLRRKCRLVALEGFTGYQEFTGYRFVQPLAAGAKQAVAALMRIMNGAPYEPRQYTFENQLKPSNLE